MRKGVLAGVVAVTWILTHGETVSAQDLFPNFEDDSVAVLAISGQAYGHLQQMVGNFGWLDTVAPPLTYLVWFAALGTLLLLRDRWLGRGAPA